MKTPRILFRTRNFVILFENLLLFLLYLPFTNLRHLGIERQVPFQEIFNTCCESLKKYILD